MANAGFFEQKSASPTRFALVVAGHAALLAAVMLAAGPQFTRHRDPPIIVTPIPVPEAPPPDPQTERTERQMLVPPDQIVAPQRPFELPPAPGPGVQVDDPPSGPTSGGTVIADPPPQNPPVPPVRRGAELDPRFASALQPQYPASEQRAGGTAGSSSCDYRRGLRLLAAERSRPPDALCRGDRRRSASVASALPGEAARSRARVITIHSGRGRLKPPRLS